MENNKKYLSFKTVTAGLIVALLAIAAFGFSSALASDKYADISSTQIKVEINKTGDQTGVATLDKTIYYAGDSAVLTWRGACVGDDFVIPKSISYNNTSYDLATLNKMDSMQTANEEYARRMGSSSTMTTYESIENFITKNNTIALPNLTIDTVVTVEFVKVSPVYRMYNMISSEHLFSTNKVEYDNWVEIGRQDKDAWVGEGIDWLAPTAETSDTVIHRLYNPGLGAMGHSSHYYTADAVEMANLMSNYGWLDDGEDNYIRSGGTQSIYTCYNEALGSAHHYSSSQTEWAGLEEHQWALERDKNGDTGVFQGVAAVRWYTPNSYYTVYHQLEGLDGKYTTYETQTIQGAPKSTTNAKAKEYAGYTAQNFSQTTVDAANITRITIKYSRNTYTVKFDGNGQDISIDDQSVKYGQRATVPETPNAADQEFVTWCWDAAGEQPFDFNTETIGLNNITLYAKWTKVKTATYSVWHIYQKVDGTYAEERSDESVVVDDPKEGKPGDLTQARTKNLTGLTAIPFEQVKIAEDSSTIVKIKYERAQYKLNIDYQGKGGVENPQEQTLYYEQEFTIPADPADDQYKFIGWYTSSDLSSKFEGTGTVKMPNNNLTLYAGWREKGKPTITFETNGGTKVESLQVTAGQTVQRPVEGSTAKAGYDFDDWYANAELTEKFNFEAPINDDVVIYAKWIPHTDTPYQVVHQKQNVDGSYTNAVEERENSTGTSGQIAPVVAKAEYSIDGFVIPTELPQEEIKGDGTTVVVIRYERKTFSVTFSAGKGKPEPEKLTGVRYGETIGEPSPEPSATGSQFGGWFKDSDCTEKWNFETDKVTETTTLYAKWDVATYPIEYILKKDNVTNSANPSTYKYGEGVSVLAEPTCPGVTFEGWYTDPGYAADTKVTSIDAFSIGKVTLYANWTEATLTVQYNIRADETIVTGDYESHTNLKSEDTITIKGKDIKNPDMALAGWSTVRSAGESDKIYAPGDRVKVSEIADKANSKNIITLYAQWAEGVSAIFDMNDHGTQVKTQMIVKGNAIAEPAFSEYGIVNGLRLEGWYTDEICTPENKWDFSTTITTDKYLYANWVVDDDQYSYWLGHASTINTTSKFYQKNNSYISEEWNVELSSEQIQNDMKILHEGESNTEYANVKTRWESYMNDDNYHLYTKIGSGTEKNDYVEFAVLQVGPHTSIGDKTGETNEETGEVDNYKDDAAVSFMSIYSLPETYKVSDAETEIGGWGKYKISELLGAGGKIFNMFKTALTRQMVEVTKWTQEGLSSTGTNSTTMLKSTSKLWIMSTSELSNAIYRWSNKTYKCEGDQYDRLKQYSYSGYYPYTGPVYYMGHTRDLKRVAPAMMRTPALDVSSKSYIYGLHYGNWYYSSTYYSYSRTAEFSVAPCFAF